MEAEDTSPTTEAWLDQLPREVVGIIVEHLARAGMPDIKNDRGASFTAYQGYVGMSVMNRALHAALPVQRSVEVVIRSPIMWPADHQMRKGFGVAQLLRLPLMRDGTSLSYHAAMMGGRHSFGMPRFMTFCSRPLVESVKIFAPEIFTTVPGPTNLPARVRARISGGDLKLYVTLSTPYFKLTFTAWRGSTHSARVVQLTITPPQKEEIW